MARYLWKRIGTVEIHHDSGNKQYIIMPDRYDPETWLEYDEDEKDEMLRRAQEEDDSKGIQAFIKRLKSSLS